MLILSFLFLLVNLQLPLKGEDLRVTTTGLGKKKGLDPRKFESFQQFQFKSCSILKHNKF